jgi:hypothetical protein
VPWRARRPLYSCGKAVQPAGEMHTRSSCACNGGSTVRERQQRCGRLPDEQQCCGGARAGGGSHMRVARWPASCCGAVEVTGRAGKVNGGRVVEQQGAVML